MGTRPVALVLAAATVVSLLAVAWRPPSTPLRPLAGASAAPRPLDRIPPGTPLPGHPPEGWTHLVIKSRSALDQGDVDRLHPLAVPMAEFLLTGIVARVGPERTPPEGPYRLEAVAIGLATEIDGQDVVITGETADALGADLGPIKKAVLAGAERRLDRVVRIAASDTTVVFDSPTDVFFEGRVRRTVYRYAVLADPEDGRLAAVVWRVAVDRPPPGKLMDPAAVRLAPNLVATCRLHVDGRRVMAGIPAPDAFAVTGLPPGEPVPVPPWFLTAAAAARLDRDAFGRIDATLRGAIGFSPGR